MGCPMWQPPRANPESTLANANVVDTVYGHGSFTACVRARIMPRPLVIGKLLYHWRLENRYLSDIPADLTAEDAMERLQQAQPSFPIRFRCSINTTDDWPDAPVIRLKIETAYAGPESNETIITETARVIGVLAASFAAE